MSLFSANVYMFFELNGGPLSDNWYSGLPYVSYIAAIAWRILSAGKREARSCTTTMCLEEGIGPNKSTATDSQHLDGTLCAFIGYDVFLSENEFSVGL